MENTMHQTLDKAVKSNVQKKNQMGLEMQKELVCKEVLQTLGPVKDLFEVIARNVYDNRWRVDVWTEEWKPAMYGPSYRIKHSYFCKVQDNCIAFSDPKIEKIY
tara:strand:- start:86 stop:397 length:312 start_codon:yes stop_codon:yes gene_type:complete